MVDASTCFVTMALLSAFCLRRGYLRRPPFFNGLRPLGLGGFACAVRVSGLRLRASSYARKISSDALTWPVST